MGKQREGKLSGKIMAEIRRRGGFCFKAHGSEYQMAGLPDVIVCYRGWFLGFETKMPGERDNVSKIQAHVHRLIANSAGLVHVVCSVAEVTEILDQFDLDLEVRKHALEGR